MNEVAIREADKQGVKEGECIQRFYDGETFIATGLLESWDDLYIHLQQQTWPGDHPDSWPVEYVCSRAIPTFFSIDSKRLGLGELFKPKKLKFNQQNPEIWRF